MEMEWLSSNTERMKQKKESRTERAVNKAGKMSSYRPLFLDKMETNPNHEHKILEESYIFKKEF